MQNKYFWCDNCQKKYEVNEMKENHLAACEVCFRGLDYYHSPMQHLLEFADSLAGVKTKENLIRYIVCDGEPADESCVGHPVLVSNYINFSWNHNLILSSFDTKNYPFVYSEKGDLEGFQFAKKKTGYDYTRKPE